MLSGQGVKCLGFACYKYKLQVMYKQVSYVFANPPVEFGEGVEEGIGCPSYYCKISPTRYNPEADREETTLHVLQEGKPPRYYLVFKEINDSQWLWGNVEIIPRKIPERVAKVKEKRTAKSKKN